MTAAVIPISTVVGGIGHNSLDAIAADIKSAHERVTSSTANWVDASLDLAKAMRDGRDAMPANTDFGAWLKERGLDFYHRNDRSALIGFANDLNEARKVLSESATRSYQLIWRQHRSRLPNNSKTTPSSLRQRLTALIAAKPERSNGDIAAETGAHPKTVQKARRAWSDSQPAPQANGDEAPTAKKNRAASVGAKIPLPAGCSCITDAVQRGIALERDNKKSIDEVSEAIGLSRTSYSRARDIVLLAERSDLCEQDASTVRRAFDLLNTDRRLPRPMEMIKHIIPKVWGKKGNRFKSDKTRIETFCDSISFVVSTCTAVTAIQIPVLDRARRRELDSALKEAIDALRSMRDLIKGQGDD